jgi:hypothetical protein
VKDSHPIYRAMFYIHELKKAVDWPSYLEYYREQDRDIATYSGFCAQMWANYMNDEVRRQTPLTYAQYISKYEELLKEGYNQRYRDGRS